MAPASTEVSQTILQKSPAPREAVTFDDVLILPAYSEVAPAEADVATRFSRGVALKIPLCSAAMDTVTEAALAIALAQEGGIGVIHRNLPIEAQAREVEKVKRSENGVITDPLTLPPSATLGEAKQLMSERGIGGIPIVDGERLVGILTNRDLRFQKNLAAKASTVMTHDRLVTAAVGTTLEQAKEILHKHKVEKLLLLDRQGRLKGLITIKDIRKIEEFPRACRDGRGRLRTAAAVGVDDEDRVAALVEHEVDVLVVDTAHGHSLNVIETVKAIKRRHPIEVVAGNVATAEAARALLAAGADGIKVGIGPGSICTTRVTAGIGVPQVTAILDCAAETRKAKVPLIADGGIRYSGDLTKAIVAGADCIMIGSLFAGTQESPGDIVLHQGRSYKVCRGMGSLGAMMAGQAGKERYGQGHVRASDKLVPEGIEGQVPYAGPLAALVYQMVGGLRAGMGYTGARTIAELQSKGRFIRVSHAGLAESHPHNILITREAPNYSIG